MSKKQDDASSGTADEKGYSLDWANKNLNVQTLEKHLDKLGSKQIKNIKSFNLSSNALTYLPDKFKEMFKSSNLYRLDLSNNPFENFHKIIEILSSISSLTDLKITITRHEEALSLLSEVPQLQRLNDKSTRDEIELIDIDEQDIEQVSLNKEISNFNSIFIKIKAAVSTKIINNDYLKKMIDSFQELLNSEIERINSCIDSSVPNYIYASSVSGSKSKIYMFFINSVINLIHSNGLLKDEIYSQNIVNKVKSTNNTRKSSRKNSAKNSPRSSIKNPLVGIKEVQEDKNTSEREPNEVDPLAQFENEDLEDPLAMYEKEVNNDLKSKNEKKEGSKIPIATPRKDVNPQIVVSSKEEQIKTLTDLLQILNECGKYLIDCTDEAVEVVNKLHPKIEEQHEFMKKLEKSENENSIMVVELERKNEQLLAIINSQKKEIQELKSKLKEDDEDKRASRQQQRNSSTIVKKQIRPSSVKSVENSKLPTKNLAYTMQNTSLQLTNVKTISIKSMLDLIQEIYLSKVNYDKKCYDNKLPRETLEQHMYTYFYTKYGLKSLVIEYAAAVVNSIKKFSKENVDVSLFGKILRNDLEEDYRLIYYKLKSTMFELLTYYLRTKNQYKSKSELDELVKSKIKGSLNQEEWTAVVYFLYDEKDSKNIENKINYILDKIDKEEANKSNQGYSIKKKGENKIIMYSLFEKIIMNYQVISRVSYLANFTMLFRTCDSDGDGILTNIEFMSLVQKIKCYGTQTEEQSLRLLEIVDPFYLKKITFSDAVGLFSKEQLELDGSVINVLDFMSQNWEKFKNLFNN